MKKLNSTQKGNLLEDVIEQICEGIAETKVSKKAKIQGLKSNTKRDVDILIEGKIGIFDVKIAIEAKNYKEPVGLEKVESLKSKLEDIGVDLGIMVCPTGFTKPAKDRASFDGIQLFEIFDPEFNNSNLFLPLRYIESEMIRHSFSIKHRAGGAISIPEDVERWRFVVNGEQLTHSQLIRHGWNTGLIPQLKGVHRIDFGTMTIIDVDNQDLIQYFEVGANVMVEENYFLKLFPASYLKDMLNGEEKFHLRIDVYSGKEDMSLNGWKEFQSFEDMNNAADIENQPEGIRGLIIRSEYSIESKKMNDQPRS
jgi:hypothetical protein